MFVLTPYPQGARFLRVQCGSNHTVGLTVDGDVYGWGCLQVGQVIVPPEASRRGAMKKKLEQIIWKNPRKPQAEPSIVIAPFPMNFTSILGRKKPEHKARASPGMPHGAHHGLHHNLHHGLHHSMHLRYHPNDMIATQGDSHRVWVQPLLCPHSFGHSHQLGSHHTLACLKL